MRKLRALRDLWDQRNLRILIQEIICNIEAPYIVVGKTPQEPQYLITNSGSKTGWQVYVGKTLSPFEKIGSYAYAKLLTSHNGLVIIPPRQLLECKLIEIDLEKRYSQLPIVYYLPRKLVNEVMMQYVF